MKKFEYFVLPLDVHDGEWGEILDGYGRLGWELVSVVETLGDEDTYSTFYFKREIEG